MDSTVVREGTLSFGFSKVVTKRHLGLGKSEGAFSKEATEEDVDFVTGMVGSHLTGSRSRPKKAELIIPLQAKSNQSTVGSWSGLSAGPLIEFSLSGGSVGGSEKSTLEDYDRIPVSDFGLAMLRGMGWKAEEGIGLKNKRVVEMKEPEVRPRGLGLGAERPQSNKDILPPSKSKEEVKVLSIKIGAFAVITRGSNKGLYGQIESYDEDNNRVIMKLAIGSQMAAVSKFYIDLVDAEEYKKKSKILNNEKYEEYKLKQENRNAERESEIAAKESTNGERKQNVDNDNVDEVREITKAIVSSVWTTRTLRDRSLSVSPSRNSDDLSNDRKKKKRSKHSGRDKDSKRRKKSRRDRDYR